VETTARDLDAWRAMNTSNNSARIDCMAVDIMSHGGGEVEFCSAEDSETN